MMFSGGLIVLVLRDSMFSPWGRWPSIYQEGEDIVNRPSAIVGDSYLSFSLR